jgi:hypothetical protein
VALREGRLCVENPCWQDDPDVAVSAAARAERIAWLVHHGWDTSTEALQVNFGEYGGIGLNDGSHRLYAAAFRGLTGSRSPCGARKAIVAGESLRAQAPGGG